MDEAISYRRFSTPKQARGYSDRRQIDLTHEYCARHNLRLIDSYFDGGLSGFTGENLSDGSALTALLQAARVGRFKPGTRLIVESLDRISRREISLAIRLFLDILDSGLVIVTLIDGEQIFTKERVDTDLTALIIAIVYLSRANNESKNRQERALRAQQMARRKAREQKIPITAECPSWLRVVRRRGKRRFVIREDRAEVIRHIFEMASGGMGQPQISNYLNSHHFLPFSGTRNWRPGMVAHLLKNEAVIGRFHPCLSIVEGGRRRRIPDPDGPIEGYFPAILDEGLYRRARVATRHRLQHKGGRRVPAYSNLVTRLGRCAVCGGSLYHTKSSGGWSYLRCADALGKQCPNRFGFPYRILESVLLALPELTEIIDNLGSVSSTALDRLTRLTVAEWRSMTTRSATHQTSAAARARFLSRFRALRANARSTDIGERDFGRHALIGELGRFLDGVVLHANRTLTLHIKADGANYRVTYLLHQDGVYAIQLKMPDGKTGFIDRSVVAGLVKPVKSISKFSARDNEGWQPVILDEALSRVELFNSPGGDWLAIAPDPRQLSNVVYRAEQALMGPFVYGVEAGG